MDNAFVGTIWSLAPPFVAIILAIITHRTLLSLGVGILLGALLMTDFQPLAALSSLGNIIVDLFWHETINDWTINIILFLLLLGLIAAFISLSGGKHAFAKWALTHIKTQRGASLFTVLLGILIFIDDYFNSLAVGNISRPVTDKQRISRAKLAYFLDSTAAPICVISPFSSWGAYIISILGTLFVTNHIVDYSPMTAFLHIIPFNFYALFTILMVFIVACVSWDIGPMRQHQINALRGELFDATKGDILGDIESLPQSDKGRIRDLVLPILMLIFCTILALFGLGYYALPADATVTSLALLEHTNVPAALVLGGLAGALTALLFLLPKKLPWPQYKQASIAGIKSMLPAIYILLFAWTLIEIIDGLETGTYMVSLLKQTVSLDFLPFLFFIVAGITAFATGTSWGTFGILLPLAAEIGIASGSSTLLIPTFGAVLAGAVFGDHCSPISDTTILSSSGAGSHHIDHVVTQLPYAMFCAFCASVGYFMMAYISAWQAFACAFAVFVAGILLMRAIALRKK